MLGTEIWQFIPQNDVQDCIFKHVFLLQSVREKQAKTQCTRKKQNDTAMSSLLLKVHGIDLLNIFVRYAIRSEKCMKTVAFFSILFI